jgi:hypothetical protein
VIRFRISNAALEGAYPVTPAVVYPTSAALRSSFDWIATIFPFTVYPRSLGSVVGGNAEPSARRYATL